MRLLLAFGLIVFSLSAMAGVQYSYNIPTEWGDSGDPLLITDIDSYIVRYSIDNVPQPDVIVNDASVTTVIVPGGEGVYATQIATKTTNGNIGVYSDILTSIVGPIDKGGAAKQTLSGTWVCNETPCVLEMK